MNEIRNVFCAELYKISRRKAYAVPFLILLLPNTICVALSLFKMNFTLLPDFTGFYLLKVVDTFLFPIVSTVFLAGSVGEDYSNEGMKQIISSGIDRTNIVIGQWLAHTAFLTAFTLISGAVFAVLGTVLNGFGTGIGAMQVLLLLIGEAVFIGFLVSFVHAIMHLSQNAGLAAAASSLLFLVSGLVVQMIAMYLNSTWLPDYWIVTILEKSMDHAAGIGMQMLNIAGSVLILAAMMLCCIQIFRKKTL